MSDSFKTLFVAAKPIKVKLVMIAASVLVATTAVYMFSQRNKKGFLAKRSSTFQIVEDNARCITIDKSIAPNTWNCLGLEQPLVIVRNFSCNSTDMSPF